MDDALSLERSRARAQQAASRFRRVMAIYLLLQALAGVLAILFGGDLAEMAEIERSAGMLRVIGGLALLLSLLSIPAYLRPVRSRATVFAVLAGGYVLAFLWLFAGPAMVWVGLVQLVFCVALMLLLWRYFIVELQSRP